MNRIQRLPPEISNRIAAGEVVERPASLAKELLENAIDAGARRVELTFDGGGLDRIRVADDGVGIEADEVGLAFERHATSKLRSADELVSIATLGFRGEALASIAAVSRVELTTATALAPLGTRIRLEGGRILGVEGAARAPGTTIEVTSLFYNTPARRKFLKTPATEGRVLARLAGRIALGVPGVGLRVVREGKTILDLAPASGFRERVGALLGTSTAERMAEVIGERDGVRVKGLVSLAEFSRTRADNQILLVNGRVVTDASLSHAVTAGLGGALPAGRSPIFALALEIDPARVDVNVHPTKREVRFAEKDRVYGAVREAVQRAAAATQFDAAGRLLDLPRAPRMPLLRPAGLRFGLPEDVPPATGLGRDRERAGGARLLQFSPVETEALLASAEVVEDEDAPRGTGGDDLEEGIAHETSRLRLAGELWGAYLLVEDQDRLLVIDQHAAHERVLYDELRAREAQREPVPAQGLLVPITIDLGPGQDAADAAEVLRGLGFEAREGGPSSVLVDAIPGTLSRWGGGDFLREFFVSPEAARSSAEKWRDALAKSYACKGAVKFGQRLHRREIRRLLEALSRADVPRLCPHGRPLYLELARPTIDAKFER